jgi:hypothetical protein
MTKFYSQINMLDFLEKNFNFINTEFHIAGSVPTSYRINVRLLETSVFRRFNYMVNFTSANRCREWLISLHESLGNTLKSRGPKMKNLLTYSQLQAIRFLIWQEFDCMIAHEFSIRIHELNCVLLLLKWALSKALKRL